jgi:hypothetical protein
MAWNIPCFNETFHVSMKPYFKLLCIFIPAVANTAVNLMFCERGVICVSTEGPLVFAEGFCSSECLCLWAGNNQSWKVTCGEMLRVTSINGIGWITWILKWNVIRVFLTLLGRSNGGEHKAWDMQHALRGHAVQAPCTGRTDRNRPGGLDVVWVIILKGIWNRVWLFGLD